MMEECTLALQAWKDVDLNSKRQLWENQYMEIKDHRNSSISTRKYLNESTKSFRSELANSGGNSIPVEAYMELLKSYQEEIDRLSKRAKYGETCFVELFRIVSTPMDPVDALSILIKMNVEYSAEISQQTLELERLQNEVQDYDAEFATLKNQDIKIQRLEEQIADYKDSIEEQVDKLVEARAAEIAAAAAAKSSELETLMQHSERKYRSAVDALTSTQQRLEAVQAQCYEVSSAQEDKLSAVNAENASLTETIYRGNVRLAELESQVANLQAQCTKFAAAATMTNTSSTMPATPYDDSESLHRLVADLRAELTGQEAAARSGRHAYEQRIAELTEALVIEREKSSIVTTLQRELEASQVIVSDYDSLRKQYKVLQNIVFPTHAEDQEDDAERKGQGAGGDAVVVGRSFDMLLSERIKALDSELIGVRNQLQLAQDAQTRSTAALAQQGEDLAAKTQLVQRLEDQLDRVISSEAAPGLSAAQKQHVQAENAQMEELSALLSFNSPEDTKMSSNVNAQTQAQTSSLLSSSPRKTKGSAGEGEVAGEDTSMVNVLQSQRNHFRDRLTEINKQYLLLQRKAEAAEVSNRTLESENIALFAKIKYLQSCSTPQARAYPVSMNLDIETGSNQKYEQMYEQKLNPFVEFSNAERNRKLQELNIGERMLLSTTITCVSSAAGRSVLMVYVVTMHALVFFTLYYTAHRTVICHH